MGYDLGIDLGTTFTAAAVHRDGRVEMATLGDRSAAVPSVVLLRSDGTVLTGDAADRRASSEPDRVAREVKRRLGDPMPVLLGGAPQPVQELMAMQLRDVVRLVAEREGAAPDRVTLTHPANWGPYKRELFGQIPHRAGLDRVRMVTEPEAAAAHYAATERVPDGATVAVYDLGGGTFDATVLRTSGDFFEILGTPEGIEGLGGIDFDEAVYAHVDRALDGALSALDPADIRATSAAIRLRHECVLAKEALSADTETTIPVLLPAVQTEVRLTRGELEEMILPSITATVEAMRRALRSAGVTADELHTVLLVGGSSRIPVVARTVSAELGRPTSVDAHPKHAIALGAAAQAGRSDGTGAGPVDDTPTPPRGFRAAPVGPGAPGGPVGPGTPPGGTPRGVAAGAAGLAAAGGAGLAAAGTGAPGGPTPAAHGGGTGYDNGAGHGGAGGYGGPAGYDGGAAGYGGPAGYDGGAAGAGQGPGATAPYEAARSAAGMAPPRLEAGAPPPALEAPTSGGRGRKIGFAVGAGALVATAAVGVALFYGAAAGSPTVDPAADPSPAGVSALPVAPTTAEQPAETDPASDSVEPKKTRERPAPVTKQAPAPWTSGGSEPSSDESTSEPSSDPPSSEPVTEGDGSGGSGG